VHRLHKFTIWVDRAQHRSAFFSRNMPQAAGEWMASVMGKNLSPLDATKFGLAGADHGLMSVSKNNFETTLEGAMEKVHMALLAQIDELRDAPEAPEVDQKQLAECCLRCAVIEQWRDGIGLRKNVSLNADQRAAAMREAQQLGADPKALKSSSAARQTLRLKTLEKWGYEALLGTGQSPGALRDDIATARNIARGAVAKPEGNPTSAGLRDLAAQALDTIGVTWRHQGTRGADMSVSFGLQTGSSEVTAGVGPQHRRVRGRQAAVRVGTTSAGSEIFFGTEKRKARQTGIVGRLGFGLGEVGHGAASLGMNANVLPWGTESAEEAGVSIRFPKGSPNQREQAKGVIDFLFDAADARSEGRPASGPQLWEEFAQKFVSNESISVNYQTNNSVTKRQVAGMAAAARVGIGDVAVGPGFGIAAESSKSHAERKDLHGRVPVHLVNQGTRQAVQGSVSVSGTIPRIHPSGTGLLRTVIPTNAPLGTIRTDFTLGGEQGQVRVAFNNGRVDPKLTLAYYEHRNQGDYLKHIEAKRSVWERALREEPIVDPDRPEREKPGVSGKDAVDAYIKDVLGLNIKDQTGGNRGYLDRYSLTADAAEELDLIFGQKVLLEREPSSQTVEREIRSLDAQVHKVLKATTSWMPERMAVFEIEPHTEAKGFDFILSAQSRLQAIPTLRYLVERRLPGTSSTPKAQKTRIEVPPEITEPEAPAKRGFFDRKRGEPQRKLTKTPPPKISMSNAEFLKANGYLVEPFRMPEPKTR
jgi:hypothetical protein